MPVQAAGVPSRDGVERGAIASTKAWRLLDPLFMSSHLSLARSWRGCATSAQMTLLRRVGVGWLVVREGEPQGGLHKGEALWPRRARRLKGGDKPYVMDADGTNVRRLTKTQTAIYEGAPEWHPLP